MSDAPASPDPAGSAGKPERPRKALGWLIAVTALIGVAWVLVALYHAFFGPLTDAAIHRFFLFLAVLPLAAIGLYSLLSIAFRAGRGDGSDPPKE
jgi:hypothetical protein